MVLRKCTLTLQANSKPGVPTTTGVVTGGTRSYAHVRGVFVAKDATADFTVTLAS
jgi:hypothetical protein